MTPQSVPTLVMAGISAFVGFNHLLVYSRRRSHPEDASFAILCLVTALYEVLCTGLYNSTSPLQGAQWQRAQFISLTLFVTAFLWFVMDYTGQRRGPVFWSFVAFSALAFVVQIVDRSPLTWTMIPAAKDIALPFGGRVTYNEVSLGPFSIVQGAVGMTATLYIMWRGIRFARDGHHQEVVWLLVALGMMTAAAVNDTLVSDGVYQFLYLMEYAYLALIVLMTSALSRGVVDAAIAQEDLRQAELVIDNSPVVLFRWGMSEGWPVEYVSANVRQFGYSPQQFLNGETSYSSIVHPADLPRVTNEVSRHLAAGAESFAQEYRVLARDGGERWVDDRTTVIRDPAGKVVRVQGIILDITDRRRAEAALATSEEEFRSIVENALVGIFSVNDCYQFIYCNDEMCRILGRARERVIGHDFRQFLATAYRDLVAERYRRQQAGQDSPSHYEIDIARENGEIRHVDLSVAVVRDSSGARRSLGQIVDITDRVTAEAEITRMAAQLEDRVRARTADLETAVKELEAFSYSISHDLWAPLRALSGFTRILLADHAPALPEEARRYLTTINSTAQQMGRLIDDLLDFSRLNRQPLDRRDCSMEVLVREALEGLSGEREGRKVDVTVEALPDCRGDPTMLRQVWVNLLSNALKYTRGSPEARIRVSSFPRDGQTVYCVRDNGVGFDIRYAGKLFGVFQRLHRDDEFEGTGIGLAIVKRIVERHGGRVWAESATGQGATFYFAV